ncbi:transglycosylase [Lithohypha guttulata]|uniref:transglycosylase n=1 Tax=Lithohypha guttulata TaxID=1690604 RepID=UPI002DE03755|nr:transglycosylase [Lithohypha guttulata]
MNTMLDKPLPQLIALLLLFSVASAQTYSTCNPLLSPGSCPANSALGKSVNIAFTRPSDQFTATGAPTYDSNGAAFTVAKTGDSPTIASKWYIMFGRVDFVVKAAPGTGIVSSAVLLSDCLDEIDWEWLGGDDNQVQSNYFGKGQTTTGYNRGAFHGAPGNHDGFNTYTIDWTAEQIVWSINGNTVRVLKASEAEAGQYPQTPMQIKVGSWAGGDSANAPGTIVWAGGPVDYSAGPFTMYLKGIAVTDYSTGSSYSYEGTTGTWQSIKSNGGKINTSGSGSSPAVVVSDPSYSTAAGNPSVPFSTDAAASSVYATRTGYPWVTAGASAVTTEMPQSTSSSSSALPVGSSSPGLEVKTTYNDQGFLTTLTTGVKTSTDAGSVAVPSPLSSLNALAQAEESHTIIVHTTSSSVSGVFVTASSTPSPQVGQSSSKKTSTSLRTWLAVLVIALAVPML